MVVRTRSSFHGEDRILYLDLVRKFPLTSIRSAKQLKEARVVINLLLAKGKFRKGEALYLDALSDLVAAYEEQNCPIQPASDADMLQHLLEVKGITQAQLHRDTGIATSAISEVLAGKKPLSRHMTRTFADYFKVDVSVLVAN